MLGLAACAAPVDDVDTDAGPTEPEGPVGCEDSSECPDRHICQGGVCQAVGDDGCTSKAECTGDDVCVSGTCDLAPTACANSEECPGALVCDGFSRRCVDLSASGCEVASDCAIEVGCEEGCTCSGGGTCTPTTGGGTDAGPPPDPLPTGDDVDLSGFRIENREYDPPIHIGILPDGTSLAPGQHLVLARNATKAAFEGFWGVNLGSDIVFLNAGLEGGGVPNINGDESWALISPVGTLIDETAVGQNKNRCYHRVGLGSGTDPNNWEWDNMGDAVPGSTDLPASGLGNPLIDQWSDAQEFQFEYLQIYYAP